MTGSGHRYFGFFERLALCAGAVVCSQAAMAAPEKTTTIPVVPIRAEANDVWGSTKIDLSGYVKLDVLYSRFSEGEVAQGTGRDFYLPNSIPVSAGTGSARNFLDFQAKETRLVIKTETPFEGHKVGTHLEADFIVSQGAGNELVTNAYNPGLRRAFITFDNLLVGQDWSTFQNMATVPETLDFVAFPSDGTVFIRQPQIRYTWNSFQFSLENPETSVLPGGGGPVTATNDSRLPDVVVRYNFKFGENGEFSLAGLARQLAVENPAVGGDAPVAAVDSTSGGGGVSLAGKIAFGADDLKFQVTSGKGLGRYVALGTSADAVLINGELEGIDILAAFVAYKHAWNDQWRSTVTASTFSADNELAETGGAVTSNMSSFSANLLYSPVQRLTFGVEFRHANRETESEADGSLDRLQFSSKFSF